MCLSLSKIAIKQKGPEKCRIIDLAISGNKKSETVLKGIHQSLEKDWQICYITPNRKQFVEGQMDFNLLLFCS